MLVDCHPFRTQRCTLFGLGHGLACAIGLMQTDAAQRRRERQASDERECQQSHGLIPVAWFVANRIRDRVEGLIHGIAAGCARCSVSSPGKDGAVGENLRSTRLDRIAHVQEQARHDTCAQECEAELMLAPLSQRKRLGAFNVVWGKKFKVIGGGRGDQVFDLTIGHTIGLPRESGPLG